MLLYSRARTFSYTKVLHLTFHKRQLWRRNFVLLLIQPMMIRACFCGNSNQISEPQKVKLCFLGISVLCVDFSIPPVKTICFQSSSRLRDVVFRVHHMAYKAARQPSRAKRQAKNQVCYWEDVRVDEGILSILEREEAALATIAIIFRSRSWTDGLLIQGL